MNPRSCRPGRPEPLRPQFSTSDSGQARRQIAIRAPQTAEATWGISTQGTSQARKPPSTVNATNAMCVTRAVKDAKRCTP